MQWSSLPTASKALKCSKLHLSTGNVPINGVKTRLAAVQPPKVLSIASERERCSHQWSSVSCCTAFQAPQYSEVFLIIDDDDVLPSTVHADELSKLHSKCYVLQLYRKVMAINGVKLSFPSERLLLHSKRLRCASEHQRAGHETHFQHSFTGREKKDHSFTAIQHFREKLFWSQTVYIHIFVEFTVYNWYWTSWL